MRRTDRQTNLKKLFNELREPKPVNAQLPIKSTTLYNEPLALNSIEDCLFTEYK